MRRKVAFIILGIGILTIVAGVIKVLPGGITTGAVLAIFGILLGGLSFIPQPQPSADAPPPMTAFERTAGVFYEPKRVFQNLRAHPRWLTALLVISLVSVVYNIAFTQRLGPDRIATHMSQKLVESGWVPADQAEKMRQQQIAEAGSPIKKVSDAINTVVGMFALMLFLAALILLIVMMFGGRINLWQALAVSLHASLPAVVISKLLSIVLLYLKAPEDIHPVLGAETLVQDNLGVLFSPAEHPVLFVAATFIGVLSIYRLWLLATGIKYGAEKVSSSGAWTTSITIFVLTFILAVASTALFPGFLS